jgi:hypothetical protein
MDNYRIALMLFLVLAVSYHNYQKTIISNPNHNVVVTPDTIKPTPVPKPPKIQLNFVSVSEYRNIVGDCIYADVLKHSKAEPYGDAHGRYTNVHETAHSIHNELRNEYKALLKIRVNGFYCLNGKAVILKEPPIEMRHIIPYIPLCLRSNRYKLYFTEQIKYWNDTPSYVLDEWNCYILGGACAIDDYCRNIPLDKTNAVSGSLEFAIYSVALCMAVKDHHPEYWQNNLKTFKAFIAHSLKKTETIFYSGKDIPEFADSSQDKLLHNLLYDSLANEIRNFLKEEFDGTLLNMNDDEFKKK